MSRCLPRVMGNVVLLKHASDIYTPRAFEVFQGAYEKSLNVLVNQHSRNRSLIESTKQIHLGILDNTMSPSILLMIQLSAVV